MRRAVIDLNVLISALIAPQGRPVAVLTAWLGGEFELIVSEGMLDDLAAVLGRRKLISRVTREQAARLAGLLRTHSGDADLLDQTEARPPVVSPADLLGILA